MKKKPKIKKQITAKKKIISTSLQLLLALIGFIIIVTVCYYYKHTHHGYNSSEKVITTFITHWGSNYKADALTCFNTDSKTYDTVINDLKADNHANIKITAKDIDITTQSGNDEILNQIKLATGLEDIIDNEISNVTIHTVQDVDGTPYNYEYIFTFVTYKCKDKWFIDSYKLQYTRQLNKTSEDDIAVRFVGSDKLGYIAVPETWVDNTIYTKTDSVLDEISSISPTKDAIITLNIVDESVSKSMLIEQICNNFETNEMAYTVEQATLAGYTATRITSSHDKEVTIMYLLNVPLRDSYTHTIVLNCFSNDAEYYHDEYIQSFTLSH